MKLSTDSCQMFMYMVFGHDRSLVSFGDRDLIFTVTMRHKLKYLSKIMTYSVHVCTKPIEPGGEFYLDLHEYILWTR